MKTVSVGGQIINGLDGWRAEDIAAAGGTAATEIDQTNGLYKTRVELQYDATEGIASWYIHVLDPAKRAANDGQCWPDDPDAGVLQPNVVSPEGEGYIVYSVKVREDAPANAVIDNSANIVFDQNAAIITDPAWWNTVAEMAQVELTVGGVATNLSLIVGMPYGELPEPPARTGYTFGGWYTAPGGSAGGGRRVTAQSLVESGDSALYESWLGYGYTVAFDKAAEDAVGVMSAQAFEYGQEQDLDACAYSRAYHDFAGWATNATGRAVFADRQRVGNLTSVSNGLVRLYATWTRRLHTVTFYVDGDLAEVVARRTGVGEGLSLGSLPDVAGRAPHGYSFGGWAVDGLAPGASAFTAATPVLGDWNVYAVWKPNEYTLTFRPNGGTVGVASKRVTYGVPVGELPVPAWSGHVFRGWFTAATGGIEVSAETAATGNMTLYARWAESYAVVLHRNDGSTTTYTQDIPVGETARLMSLAKLGWAKRGFEFKGWSKSAGATKATYGNWANVKDLTASGGTIDLYAVWELKPGYYAILFVRNDGAGTMLKTAFEHGVKTRMPSLANGLKWARRGYEFLGWALTTADANAGKTWKGDWAYVSTPTKAGSTLTVYAVWRLKAGYYQIRFNRNDGTGKWRSLGFARDASTRLSTISGLGWERPGYVFGGWASSKANADAGKVWKTDGEWVKNAVAEGKTLSIYALWRKAPGSVSIQPRYAAQVDVRPGAAFAPICRTGELDGGAGEWTLYLESEDADGVMSGHVVFATGDAIAAFACDAVWLEGDLLVETEEGLLLVLTDDGAATILQRAP